MAKRRKRSLSIRAMILTLKILILLLIISVFQVISVSFINPPFTFSMLLGWVQEGSPLLSESPRKNWRKLEDISPNLRRAVLAAEDQRFLLHHGFDFIEMNNAVKDIFRKGTMRGASTVSMQAARTVFLWPSRNLVRKALEAYYTLLLELFCKKERIFELYLNTVDWGTGIMGAEEASRRYFNRSAKWLTPSQAASLAAVLPSPHKWSPTKPDLYVLERKKRILKDINKMPLLS